MTPEEQLLDICERCSHDVSLGRVHCGMLVCGDCPYALEIELIIGNYPDYFIVTAIRSFMFYRISFVRRCGHPEYNMDCAKCRERRFKR